MSSPALFVKSIWFGEVTYQCGNNSLQISWGEDIYLFAPTLMLDGRAVDSGNMKVASLMHRVNWQIDDPSVILDERLSINDLENSAVGTLYEILCKEKGLDDSDPYDFNVYLLFKDRNVMLEEPSDPFSILARLHNILTICLGQPIGMSRLIASDDDFQTCIYTTMSYYYPRQTNEFLGSGNLTLDNDNIDFIKSCYLTEKELREKHQSKHRVLNALEYYFYSWRAHYLEQTCINLSIVLESLFAPNSNTELAHQIAYNVSHFFGTSADEKREIFSKIKKFYQLRSQIVHGDAPDQDKICENVPEIFIMTSYIIRKILCDRDLSMVFNDNPRRVEYLSQYLF